MGIYRTHNYVLNMKTFALFNDTQLVKEIWVWTVGGIILVGKQKYCEESLCRASLYTTDPI